MYLADGDIEEGVLRQGDIIKDVHHIGALNLNSIILLTNPSGEASGWQVPNPPQRGDAIVLSHSCELDLENNGTKVTSVILAPIRDVNTATDKSKIDELIASNYVNEETGASYLKYFYLEASPHLEYSDGAIVDFSKCYSVRKQCYKNLTQNKVSQLEKVASDQMALKFSLYFYREQQAREAC